MGKGMAGGSSEAGGVARRDEDAGDTSGTRVGRSPPQPAAVSIYLVSGRFTRLIPS